MIDTDDTTPPAGPHEADAPTGLATEVVVGRQGIYDTDGSVVGYELLFRGVAGDRWASATGDQMTAEVIYGAHAIGLDHLVSGRLIFCNAARGMLQGDVALNLPPGQTVVEVLETVTLDADALDGCRRLVAAGYRLAADDFVWRPGAEELLPLTSIVKIDLLQTQGQDLLDMVARCKEYDVQLLAEKVEDLAELPALRELGFELFQGYALERPVLVSGTTLEPSQLSRLLTATTLLAHELEMEEIEEVVRSDPAIALQVIQLASVGRIGETRRRVGSLREALVLAGSQRVQNWVALLMARPTTGSTSHDRFTSTLIRSRACELLAARLDPSLMSLGFAAGMLSAVDVLLQVSPAEVRASLPLSDDLSDAAFGADTPVGRLVRDAMDFQLGRPHPPRASGFTDEVMNAAFASAFRWAMASSSALAEVAGRS